MVKDEEDSKTRVTNDELEKFRLNFSRCTNRDVAPIVKSSQSSFVNFALPKFINVWQNFPG